MMRTLARYLSVAVSFLAFVFLLSPPVRLGARGRGANSLQPDSSAVIFTMVLQRDEPVSRGNFLILPSPNSHASTYAKSGSSGGGGGHKGGGGGTGGGGSTSPCCGGPLTIPMAGSAYGYGTVVETPTTTQPEAEEEIAADPSDSQNLVAAISDFSSSSGFNNTKWALSTDAGTTWIANFVPANSSGLLLTSDGYTWDANSDPVVAMDKSENVFLSDLYITIDSSGRITAEGLYVSAGQFGSIGQNNFANTYPILTNPHNGKTFNIEDKPWITVDNGTSTISNPGYVYASWSHFTGCQNQYNALAGAYVLTCSSDSIYLSYSTDHGKTWLTTPIQISPSTQNGAVQGSQPAVGPDGKVYVTYEFFGSNNQRQQYLSVGTWSGSTLTFSTPFAVSPVFNELTFAGCSTCSVSYRVNSFPNVAVAPATGSGAGNVYLVYGAQATSTSTAQVNFMACTNNCTSSSSFNGAANLDFAAAGEHFFPAISVDSNGVINTSWFDTRSNPSNADYLDIYGSYLTYDSGSNSFTLSPNAEITAAPFDASEVSGFGDTSFIGDYIGIAATPGTAHPVWTDVTGILGYPLSGGLQTRTVTVP